MSSRQDTRSAISALLRAGKTVKEIVADVQGGRTLVYSVKKRLDAGKSVQVSPRKRKRTTLTPRVVAGLRCRILSLIHI